MKGSWRRTVTGAAVLFVSISIFMTVTVLVYAAATQKYGDNTAAISIIMLICVAFFALTCTVIDILRRRMSTEKPLKDIAEATARIAEGDFGMRLEINKPRNRFNEFDCIKENINAMAQALAGSRATGEQFIANAGHELKTPVAVIQSYASALCSDKLSDEEKIEYARTIAQTSRRMAATINNILKLNKLENGKILQSPENFSLDENVAESILTFEDAIDKKQIELTCDIEEISAKGYPEYLSTVWSNLISNAVKFCGEGGHINISLKRQGGEAAFTITDDGCGIPADAGKKIFDKFWQGDTSHSSEGNGLGLAMVKKVVDILGGEIKVESRLGEGTTFTVIINIDGAKANG